jgi:hypothetical protein
MASMAVPTVEGPLNRMGDRDEGEQPATAKARSALNIREPFLVPLVVLVATRVFFWRQLPFASEDAYITYRFARNLVVGYGLGYNPGQRVMGFSSPLWTMWNAAGYALVHNPVLWSRVWSVACDGATLFLVGSLLRRHASRASAWCFTLFFALWTYFAAVAVSGMEMSAMLALMAVAATLVERRNPGSGIALGALALMRPEGLVAAGIIAIGARWRDRLVALTITAAGLGALWAYFGTIVPQSVIAKSMVYGTPGPLEGRQWWEWASPFAFGRWPVTTEGSILFAMAIVSGPAIVVGGKHLWRRRSSALAGFVGATVAVWLGYSALGVAYFSWYLAVPLAGAATLTAIGIPQMAKGPALYVSLLVFVLGTWTIAPTLYRARAYAEYASFGGAAEYLASHSQVGQKVLLEPIGMVGWRCKLWVVDEVGLVSPQVSRRRLQGPGWMTDVIRDEKPDWLVMRRGALRDARAYAGVGKPFRSLVERDALLAGYSQATVIHPEGGDEALAILAKRP